MPRPPKSTAELKLHGGFRKDRHSDRENEPQVGGLPEKPKGLCADAAWFWDLVMSEYRESGPVRRLDTGALWAACDLWSKYRAASRLAENDPIEKNIRIAVTAYYAAWERAAAKLGLNPVDRRRVRVETDGKKTGVHTRVRRA